MTHKLGQQSEGFKIQAFNKFRCFNETPWSRRAGFQHGIKNVSIRLFGLSRMLFSANFSYKVVDRGAMLKSHKVGWPCLIKRMMLVC